MTANFVRETRAKGGVNSVTTGDFISANRISTIEIESTKGRRISCVLGMLVLTNDGFPVFQNLRLPRSIGEHIRYRALAYDSGSEVNTESCDHVPGSPCNSHFVGEAENGTVQLHEGLKGIADLSVERHSWDEPAIRGRITRIR